MNLVTVIVIIFAIAIILAAVILILSLTRMQERRLVKSFKVEISNKGNARSRYEVWATDTMHDFTFDFTVNGATLGQPAAAQPVGQNLLESSPSRPAVRAGQNVQAAARNAGEKVSALNSTVGEFFNTLGHWLPGSVGETFLSWSMRLRQGQAAVEHTQRVNAQVQGMVAGRGNSSPLSSLVGGDDSGSSSIASSATTAASTRSATAMRPQTPYIEPGKQLLIDLQVRPLARLKSEAAPFTLFTRSLDQPDAQQLAQDGKAVFTGMAGIRFYLPQIVVGVVAFILVVALLAITRVLG